MDRAPLQSPRADQTALLAEGIDEWCAAPPGEIVDQFGEAALTVAAAADVKYEAYRVALTGAEDAVVNSPQPS